MMVHIFYAGTREEEAERSLSLGLQSETLSPKKEKNKINEKSLPNHTNVENRIVKSYVSIIQLQSLPSAFRYPQYINNTPKDCLTQRLQVIHLAILHHSSFERHHVSPETQT